MRRSHPVKQHLRRAFDAGPAALCPPGTCPALVSAVGAVPGRRLEPPAARTWSIRYAALAWATVASRSPWKTINSRVAPAAWPGVPGTASSPRTRRPHLRPRRMPARSVRRQLRRDRGRPRPSPPPSRPRLKTRPHTPGRHLPVPGDDLAGDPGDQRRLASVAPAVHQGGRRPDPAAAPQDQLLRQARARWNADPALRADYKHHRPNVERAIAQVATSRAGATTGPAPGHRTLVTARTDTRKRP